MRRFSDVYNQPINENIIVDFIKWLFSNGDKSTNYTYSEPQKKKIGNKDFYATDTTKLPSNPKLAIQHLEQKQITDELVERICNGDKTDISKKQGMYMFLNYYNSNKDKFKSIANLDLVYDKESKFTYGVIVYGTGTTIPQQQQQSQEQQQSNEQQTTESFMCLFEDEQQQQQQGNKFMGILVMDVYTDKNIDRVEVAKKMFKVITDNGSIKELQNNGYKGIKINYNMLEQVGLAKALPSQFDSEEKSTDGNYTYKSYSFDKNEPISRGTEAKQQPTEAPTEAPTEQPTEEPTQEPTEAPTEQPTEQPQEQEEENTEELSKDQKSLVTQINKLYKLRQEISDFKTSIRNRKSNDWDSLTNDIQGNQFKWFRANGITKMYHPIFESSLADKKKDNDDSKKQKKEARQKRNELLLSFEECIKKIQKLIVKLSDEEIEKAISSSEDLQELSPDFADVTSKDGLEKILKIEKLKNISVEVGDGNESEYNDDEEDEKSSKENDAKEDTEDNKNNEEDSKKDSKEDTEEDSEEDKELLEEQIKKLVVIKCTAQQLKKIAKKHDSKHNLEISIKQLKKLDLTSYSNEFFDIDGLTLDDITEVFDNTYNMNQYESTLYNILSSLNFLLSDNPNNTITDKDVKEICGGMTKTMNIPFVGSIDMSFLQEATTKKKLKKILKIDTITFKSDKKPKDEESTLQKLKNMVKKIFKSKDEKDDKKNESYVGFVSLKDYITENKKTTPYKMKSIIEYINELD